MKAMSFQSALDTIEKLEVKLTEFAKKVRQTMPGIRLEAISISISLITRFFLFLHVCWFNFFFFL